MRRQPPEWVDRARGKHHRARRAGTHGTDEQHMTEWLETDGLGGFAMGTADWIRTRRYHALLLAATAPPEGRMVLVADLEVFVETDQGRWGLSSHRYRGEVVHPDGATRISRFTHA